MDEFYSEEQRVFGSLKQAGFSPRVVFDIGSSDGGWSLAASEVFPEAMFHLFEPLIDFKEVYRKTVTAILAMRPNFSLHKIALGATNGPTSIFSDTLGHGASLLARTTSEYLPESFPIEVRRLDSLTRDLSLPIPDVLKIDVQGFELFVLEGAGEVLNEVKVIQVEGWLDRGYGPATPLFHELKTCLNERGFVLFELVDFHYFGDHHLYALDSYFARRDVLNQFGPYLAKTRGHFIEMLPQV
jgi:FkbM family methyltransferase